jgi:2-aminoadipate transaminase
VDVERVLVQAADQGVIALPGTQCFPDGQGTHHLRLSFSLQPLDRLAEGVRRLGRAIRSATA